MPITTHTIKSFKKEERKIVALTAYDYLTAKLLDKSGVDIILVGDSLGQVALGLSNTLEVTFDDMLHHSKAVINGVSNALVVVDMPFLTYQVDIKDAVYNAGRFIQAGAKAVKLEGASSDILKTIGKLVEVGIPVVGHLGFTPQSINTIGGNRVQSRNADQAKDLLKQAKDLENAGCFSIVLELVPSEVSSLITSELLIPTIGIGAGSDCDGQILVTDDLLGRFEDFKPSFVRQYADVNKVSKTAIESFIFDVQNGNYPQLNESFFMNEVESEKLKSEN